MTPEQLHILQHSLGVDQYGQHPKSHKPHDEGDGRGPYYRNHFVTGELSNDYPLCQSLCDMGLMRMARRRPTFLAGDMDCFYVTLEGMSAMREHSPKPPANTNPDEKTSPWPPSC